jgi:transketolase
MKKNDKIWLLTGDLGYKMWDPHFKDFPKRCINCGAAEQAMIGMAVGLALEGKVPFCYSITPFLIYRPYEWIRNYLHHENIPVKLVGAGRGKDYGNDGYTHWCGKIYNEIALDALPRIIQLWPEEKKDVPSMVKEMVYNRRPTFISLPR